MFRYSLTARMVQYTDVALVKVPIYGIMDQEQGRQRLPGILSGFPEQLVLCSETSQSSTGCISLQVSQLLKKREK